MLAVSPGYIETPTLRTAIAAHRLNRDRILERTLTGQILQPEELAEAVVALAQPTFRSLNGSTVVLDGGWLANGDF